MQSLQSTGKIRTWSRRLRREEGRGRRVKRPEGRADQKRGRGRGRESERRFHNDMKWGINGGEGGERA